MVALVIVVLDEDLDLSLDVFREFARDVAQAIVAEQSGLVDDRGAVAA